MVSGAHTGVYCKTTAQKMLRICELFAAANNIIFYTDPKPDKSKSKEVYVSGPQGDGMKKPVPLLLCGRPLPWVARAEHLGHALSEDGTMLHDVHEKKARSLAR